MRVRRLDAEGRPEKSWRGRLEVRTAQPPVRLVSQEVTPDADGIVGVPVRWTRAGDVDLQFHLAGTQGGLAQVVQAKCFEVKIVRQPGRRKGNFQKGSRFGRFAHF